MMIRETGIVPVSVIRAGLMPEHLGHRDNLLYRFLNHRAEVIYIGVTASPGVRWQSHLRTKPWANEVAEVYYTAGLPRHRAFTLEREAIVDERPIYNRTVRH